MEVIKESVFKKTSKVTYVYVFGFINNRSDRDFRGYIEVPYSYNDFISFNEEQRIAICQAVILRQTGYLVLGVMQCDPDKFFMQESK